MTRSHLVAGLLPLAILALVLAGLACLAGAPYVVLREFDEEIAASEQTLVQLRKEIAGEGALLEENRELASRGQEASLILEGGTTGIAEAKLQELVGDIVVKHGGATSSMQILPSAEEGAVVRIGIRMSISVGIDGLRDIIHGIETGEPLLFVDDIIVRTVEQKSGGADPHYLGPLDVDLQVSGYRLKDKAT